MPSVRSGTSSTTRSLSLALHSRGRTAQASVVQMQSCSYHGYHVLSHDFSPGHSALALYATGLVALLTAQQCRAAQGSRGHARFHCGSDKDSRASSHVYCHSSPTPCPSLATHFFFARLHAYHACQLQWIDLYIFMTAEAHDSQRGQQRFLSHILTSYDICRSVTSGANHGGVCGSLSSLRDSHWAGCSKISPSNVTLLVAVGACLAQSRYVHRTPQRDKHWRGLP